MKWITPLAALVAAGGLAACGGNTGATEPPVNSVNVADPSYSHLQLAVGVAKVGTQSMLNTVVTLRQPNGLSAVGYSTPSLTWTGGFVNPGQDYGVAGGYKTGSGNQDAGKAQITGVLPANPAGTAVPRSTLGSGFESWGAFGYGLNPSNNNTGGGPGAAIYPCLPYSAELLATAPNLATGTTNCAAGSQLAGGPPSFPQLRDASLSGVLGEYLGFVPFAQVVPTAPSTFTLNVAIPTNPAPGVTLTPVTATLASAAGLPPMTTPTFTPDGTGGGTITYALPAGATEGYLELADYGPDPANGSPNCNFGGAPPFFYTVEVTPASPTTIGLGGAVGNNGDNLAPTPAAGSLPAGKSTHTFCTAADNAAAAAAGVPITAGGAAVGAANPAVADQYQIVGIAFDYPAFEAAYPQSNGNPTPTIVGTNGQADLSISDAQAALGTAGAVY